MALVYQLIAAARAAIVNYTHINKQLFADCKWCKDL